MHRIKEKRIYVKRIVLFFCILCSICYIYLLIYDADSENESEKIEVIEASSLFGSKKEFQEKNDKKKESLQNLSLQNIRVLLKNAQNNSLYHEYFECYSENGMLCVREEGVTLIAPYEKVSLNCRQVLNKEVLLVPHGKSGIYINSLEKKEKQAYYGVLDIHATKDGFILVNELPVEEYLLFVVPSEMPSSYPLEALKAQAVVARSYAYYHMKKFAYEEWRAHVDDTVSFQVYHNLLSTEQTNKAVEQTRHMILEKDGEIQECMYFSTSSGNLSSKEKKFRKQIDKGNKSDLEYEEGWYRWKCTYQLSWSKLRKNLDQFVAENERNIWMKAKAIKKIEVRKRDTNGAVIEIGMQTDAGELIISSPYTIRNILVQDVVTIEKGDGTTYCTSTILPSPFFYIADIQISNDTITLYIKGGGFGHGVGMSQNGAKRLALKNKSFEEILKWYYDGYKIQSIYECLDE